MVRPIGDMHMVPAGLVWAVYSHFVNSHFVNVDTVGIDTVGIDTVRIDTVRIDTVGIDTVGIDTVGIVKDTGMWDSILVPRLGGTWE